MDTQMMYHLDATASAIMPEYWPVNEIVLQQLLFSGLRDTEIAALYQVNLREVLYLKSLYEL